jgi:hypothetical protein
MLENLKPPVKILPCKVRTILDGLNDSDQEILMEALLNRDGWKDHVLSERTDQTRSAGVSELSAQTPSAYECSCRLIG